MLFLNTFNYNIKAVLFDLDGVVVFTDRYHYLAWKKLSDEEGWEFNEAVNNRLRGIPRMESLQEILNHNKMDYPIEMKLEFVQRKNDYYITLLNDICDTDVYPGAISFIENLRLRGIKTALCSSSKNARLVLEKLQISELFDAVITGNDVKNAKPAPDIFLLATERLNIHPLHCAVFEDAKTGVMAAKSAHMKCVGVGIHEDLEKADEKISKYEEIDIDAFLETGRKSRILAEPWLLAESEINMKRSPFWESIFALTNGYMGLRGTYDEDEPLMDNSIPGMFINGVYEYGEYQHVTRWKGLPDKFHSMINLSDWRIISLKVDDEVFSMFTGRILEYRRELDMKCGILKRFLLWESPKGKRVSIKSTRIVNMKRVHSAEISYEVIPLNFSGSITLESVVKGKSKDILLGSDTTEQLSSGTSGSIGHFIYRTMKSDISIGMAFGHKLHSSNNNEFVESMRVEGDVFTFGVTLALSQNDKACLEKYGSFYTSLETEGNLAEKAIAEIERNMEDGFEALLNEQSDFWSDHWEIGDIEINGNISDQQAVRFSLFQLRQNLPTDGKTSISATGLTGNMYRGAVYWDTEMYMLPYFNYTNPQYVKPLLMYRYSILNHARRRAIEMDGKGALYSWSSMNGEETSIVYEASTAQYHINSDIAYAIWKYCISTGDTELLYNYGAEILFETARFLADRGRFIPHKDNKFCINVVCGPDEYACAVNNNCYTNMLTQFHLYFALNVYDRMKSEAPEILDSLCEKIGLRAEELELWKCAADNMYINFNHKLGIYEQDDSFLSMDPVDMNKIPKHYDFRFDLHPLNLWRMQVIKQADVVLLMFVLGDEFSKEVKKANYEYYEPRTNHGSSLSQSIHSIMASEIGLKDDAYSYFRYSAYMDINDFKGNTYGGVHFACLGGTWMSVVNGFAGMRDYEDQLVFNPYLPEQWSSYRFKINYRGRLLEVSVDGNGAQYKLIDGDLLEFRSGGRQVCLSKGNPSIQINN